MNYAHSLGECDWCPTQSRQYEIQYHGKLRDVCMECYTRWLTLSDEAKAKQFLWYEEPDQPECECGGTTAGTTHSHWCPVK